MSNTCTFVSERHHIHCQLVSGHSGPHLAWNEAGIPTLKMHG